MALAQKIIIADDHPLFRAALQQAVKLVAPEAEIVEADSMEAVQTAANNNPDADLILLDLHMPGAHGFSGLVFLRGQCPSIPVIVVSGSDEALVIQRSIDFGSSGFIPKSLFFKNLIWLDKRSTPRYAFASAIYSMVRFRICSSFSSG